MFRLWGKLIKDNHLLKDDVIVNDDSSLNRTKKVFQSLEQLCVSFDLSKPIWLDININDFKAYDKTRFHQENFINEIGFDYLEIEVIEE